MLAFQSILSRLLFINITAKYKKELQSFDIICSSWIFFYYYIYLYFNICGCADARLLWELPQ